MHIWKKGHIRVCLSDPDWCSCSCVCLSLQVSLSWHRPPTQSTTKQHEETFRSIAWPKNPIFHWGLTNKSGLEAASVNKDWNEQVDYTADWPGAISPKTHEEIEWKKRRRKVRIWLFDFELPLSSPMLGSSCKCTSQNKSRMPKAILPCAHTQLHQYTQTHTVLHWLHRGVFSAAAVNLGEACGGLEPADSLSVHLLGPTF